MKRCSLCGGRLDGNQRCILCGLDNTKSDEQYKHLVNRNDCEGEALTHVHEEVQERPSQKQTYSLPKYTGRQTAQRQKQASSPKGLGTVIALIGVIATMVGSIVNLMEDNTAEVDHEVYEYVSYDLPESGETYSITLEPGIYVVGTHIPEGTYQAEAVSGDYGMIEIRDPRNGIYLYENIGLEENVVVEDLRLYQDAYFVVGTGTIVELFSENIQSTELRGAQNTVFDKVEVTGTMVAGEDFEPGVYQVSYTPASDYEFGYFNYTVPMKDYEYEMSICFDAEVGAENYYNLVIPEGTVIELEGLESVVLVSVEYVSSTDYATFYEYY